MALYFLSTIRLPSLVLKQGTTLLTRYKKSVYFDYTTEESFFDFKQEQDVSAFPKSSRPSVGPTQSPVQLVPVFFFSAVRQSGRDAGCTPPSAVEVKNEWSCTCAPSMCLDGVDREKFTFSFVLLMSFLQSGDLRV